MLLTQALLPTPAVKLHKHNSCLAIYLAFNYVREQKMNAISFLHQNLDGDSKPNFHT
jgi:hypothetical protein